MQMAVDTKGNGQYSSNFLAPDGMVAGYRLSEGARVRSDDVHGVASCRVVNDNREFIRLVIEGTNAGGIVAETYQVDLYKHQPRMRMELCLTAMDEVKLKSTGQLTINFAEEVPPKSVYFAGRQGMVPDDPSSDAGEIFVDDVIGVCGKLHKDENTRTVFIGHENKQDGDFKTTSVERLDNKHCRITLSHGTKKTNSDGLTLKKGESLSFPVVFYFGHPKPDALLEGVEKLKGTYASFQSKADNFLYWISIIGTLRHYEGGLGLGNTTAAFIDCPPDLLDLYKACWANDPFNGYYWGAKYVAGQVMLDVLANQIRYFNATPYFGDSRIRMNNVCRNGHLSGAPQMFSDPEIILYVYDYYALTGRMPNGITIQDVKDRADVIINLFIDEWNIFGTGTVYEPKGYYTWPDINNDYGLPIQRGVNTMINSYAYGALINASDLCKHFGDIKTAAYYYERAKRLQRGINKPADDQNPKAGLWWPDKGTYGAMKLEDGKTLSDEDLGVFSSIIFGLVGKQSRIDSVLKAIGDVSSPFYDGAAPTRFIRNDYTEAGSAFVQLSPLIGGWDISARLRNKDKNVGPIWDLYITEYRSLDYPMREAYSVGSPHGQSAGNRGRIMESGVFHHIVYYGHYGLDFTPAHVSIDPFPINGKIDGEKIHNFTWQGNRYDFLFNGNGKRAVSLRVNGKDWPSYILPAESCKAQVTMGDVCKKPMLIKATDLLSVTRASNKKTKMNLTLKGTKGGGWEEIVLFYPKNLGTPIVKSGYSNPEYISQYYDPLSQQLTIGIYFDKKETCSITVEGIKEQTLRSELIIDAMEDYPQYEWLEKADNITQVSAVRDFLTSVGRIYQGCYALEAEFEGKANQEKMLAKAFSPPLNLLTYDKLRAAIAVKSDDSHRKSFVRIEITGPNNTKISEPIAITQDQWQEIEFDLKDLPWRESVKQISFSIYANGNSEWKGKFQIDNVNVQK